jgi:hypothetical protein
MKLPFEQQPGETEKAFAAFNVYLNLGITRSLAQAAARLGKHKNQLERWSKRWRWPARVQAYLDHIALVERQASEALIRAKAVDWAAREQEVRSGEWAARSRLIALAEKQISLWEAHPDKLASLHEIARFLDLASKLGRLATGMATDHTEIHTQVEAKLDPEWESALRKIYGPKPAEAVIDTELLPEPRTLNPPNDLPPSQHSSKQK